MMCNDLVKAAKDPRIKAVVIRLDSPGISPTHALQLTCPLRCPVSLACVTILA